MDNKKRQFRNDLGILDKEAIFSEVLHIKHRLEVLDGCLSIASEKELEELREMKDPSRGDEYINFFALALQLRAEKIAKELERTW